MLDALEYKINISSHLKAHGGFTIKDNELGVTTIGLSREPINAWLPLYIAPSHWDRIKVLETHYFTDQSINLLWALLLPIITTSVWGIIYQLFQDYCTIFSVYHCLVTFLSQDIKYKNVVVIGQICSIWIITRDYILSIINLDIIQNGINSLFDPISFNSDIARLICYAL